MSQPRTILICDDEEELANELGEFFEGNGWKVDVCVTGMAAVEKLRSGLAPLVLITDLRISDFDGAQVVAVARELPDSERPLMTIIITGHVMDTARAGDFMCDYLYVKPVDPDALLLTIDEFLATHLAPDTGS
ncbi:response regulator [Ancylobacter sp. WKF20]|uniref:response regulator n=1 Tax=Ancylobacter sp. WKF20 TaxID=3039801 RepID=UPI0024342FD0|nr:response regulator [Ancylobacter sp. WKF20]WGD28608.1 response regulator [Ancylobacter sp. WKF20]